jgi:hypothetical protein
LVSYSDCRQYQQDGDIHSAMPWSTAMNFRRGLFPLWIIGSALFVHAVAFVSYSAIKAEFIIAAPYP